MPEATSSSQLYQDFLGKFNSRKLLLHDPLNRIPETTNPDQSPNPAANHYSLDSNLIMVMSVLVCAVVCSLVLNALIKCVFNCTSNSVSSGGSSNNSSRNRSARNKGIKQKALKTFPVVKFSQNLKLPGLDSECVICLSEFVNGDRVRLLPKCNHGFHVRCIDKWLRANSSCPKCRHCLIETCEKIAGCNSGSSSSASSLMNQERIVVSILPLEREEMIRNPA